MRIAMVWLIGLASLQFVAGCAWLKRAIEGTETLEDRPVTALHLTTADGRQAVCAGAPVQLKVTADIEGQPSMTTWQSDPAGDSIKKGHMTFEDFTFTSSLGEVNPNDGTLVVPNTGLELLGQTVNVEVSSTHAAGHTARFSIGLHFGCGVVVNFSGHTGEPGSPGASGQSGRDGRSEQSSGSYARPGGYGEDGLAGGNGGRGGPGGHGHALTVDAAKILSQGETELVLVRITDHSAGNLSRTVLLDPAGGGRLVLRADGGPGGAGGSGGFGGRGGHGGTGYPAGDGGNGADGGTGGDGGDGGNGGKVTFRYDARHPDLSGLVENSNRGGGAGPGGGAGGAGTGGNAYSGARQGRSGRMGNPGHDGRSGTDGPPVEPQPFDLEVMFPDLGGLKFL